MRRYCFGMKNFLTFLQVLAVIVWFVVGLNIGGSFNFQKFNILPLVNLVDVLLFVIMISIVYVIQKTKSKLDKRKTS